MSNCFPSLPHLQQRDMRIENPLRQEGEDSGMAQGLHGSTLNSPLLNLQYLQTSATNASVREIAPSKCKLN